MNRNDKLRIDVMSHDKQQVLDCEKVIQKLILDFENYIKQIVLQKMSMPISTDENGIIDLRVLIDNEKQKFKLQPEVEEAYKKLKSTLSQINKNDDFYSFNVAKTKQILEGMYTIEKMKKDSDVSSYPFRIDSALQEIVIKEGRLLRSKKQNSLAVGISIFLIIQTIFIMIMISRNEILKKKIRKTLQKLSN